MDTFVKALEFGAKYAWAVFLVSAFALFVPDNLAHQHGLFSLRATSKGYLWLFFLFTGALALSGSFKYFWRYLLCPFKKLIFPVKDFRSKIKQSRIHYRRVQFLYVDGGAPIFYQGFDSNGSECIGFFDDTGHRILPIEPNNGYRDLDGIFVVPEWGKIDWVDIFNGDINSGKHGISEP